VKWSRTRPSVPSTVTVIKDAAGRYFASLIVETEPETLPEKQEPTETVNHPPRPSTNRGRKTRP
jgi:hypothetical protein